MLSDTVQTRHEPLLLCDVDGVISLWGFPSEAIPDGTWANVDGITHFLSAEAGRHLQRLSAVFELAWCTGWDDRANDHLPHVLGLPGPLETLALASPSMADKRAAIDHHAPGRPIAWIDDRLDDACAAWAAVRPAPTLLVRTDHRVGLVQEHADRLHDWARTHRGPARGGPPDTTVS